MNDERDELNPLRLHCGYAKTQRPATAGMLGKNPIPRILPSHSYQSLPRLLAGPRERLKKDVSIGRGGDGSRTPRQRLNGHWPQPILVYGLRRSATAEKVRSAQVMALGTHVCVLGGVGSIGFCLGGAAFSHIPPGSSALFDLIDLPRRFRRVGGLVFGARGLVSFRR